MASYTVTSTIHIDKLEAGDIVRIHNRDFEFIGTNAQETDAYFRNTNPRAKFALHAMIMRHGRYNGLVDMLGISKMLCTVEQLKRAHGFIETF